MEKKSLNQLYELYKDTLNKCGSYLLEESDETIEYNIFEEFDIGIVSFLHEECLRKLFEGGFITNLEMKDALILRETVLDLQISDNWNIKAIKTNKTWREVFKLCDKIKRMW